MPDFSFTTGSVPTAANWNTNVRDQVITICLSSGRPSSPVTGRHIFETDTLKLRYYDGAAWQDEFSVLAAKGIDALTTTAINALSGGSLYLGRFVFDTTLSVLKYYNGTAWTADLAPLALGTTPMTQSTRTALSGATLWAGRLVWDSTNTALYFYDGSAWQALLDTKLTKGVATVTATQRAAFSGADLYNGRLIYNSTSGVVERYNSGATTWTSIETPIGAMVDYPSLTPPSGWLLCDGTAVSRTTYAGLFAVIGTTYGPGNGSTTFNLPNYTGRTSVMPDSTATGKSWQNLGTFAGLAEITLVQANLPNINVGAGTAHNHVMNIGTYNVTAGNPYGLVLITQTGTTGTGNESSHAHSLGGSGTAFPIMQPFTTAAKIIKVA